MRMKIKIKKNVSTTYIFWLKDENKKNQFHKKIQKKKISIKRIGTNLKNKIRYTLIFYGMVKLKKL